VAKGVTGVIAKLEVTFGINSIGDKQCSVT